MGGQTSRPLLEQRGRLHSQAQHGIKKFVSRDLLDELHLHTGHCEPEVNALVDTGEIDDHPLIILHGPGAASRHEPGPAVAAAGQAHRSP